MNYTNPVKRREFIRISSCSAILGITSCSNLEPENDQVETMNNENTNSDHTFPLIEVSGNSYDMGYQHGTQTAGIVERYLVWIEIMTGKSRDVLCRNAMKFLPYFESFSPSFVDEIRGLAEGADISFEEAMLCQVRGEAANVQEGGCTAFAVKGSVTLDGQTLAGQNQDLPVEYADVSILLKVKPNDGRPRAIMFTFAGQLGFTGMNEHGVAHFLNMVYDFKWRLGLNHYPIKRVMLEKRTTAECIELFAKNRTCSARNHLLCDGSGSITDVEVRPEGIAVFKDEHPDCVVHANHYVTPEFSGYETLTLPDSPHRFSRMHELIEKNWGSITVDTMKNILADHDRHPVGICRHEPGMHSISGYIAEPAKHLFHVRRGHGCLGNWQAYEV
ncbi:C45 family autoproteolytic acyltransferase/hydrolase [Candidatus Latescibacterota bacterium]